jgi:hypothetical protein
VQVLQEQVPQERVLQEQVPQERVLQEQVLQEQVPQEQGLLVLVQGFQYNLQRLKKFVLCSLD